MKKKLFYKTGSSEHWKQEETILFLEKLAELLDEGFSLNQSLQFMQFILPAKKGSLERMLSQLESGTAFDKVLNERDGGLPAQNLVQISLSFYHGYFTLTLKMIAENLRERKKQLRQLGSMLTYPLILLLFSLTMLLAIRMFMLPTLTYSLAQNMDGSPAAAQEFIISFLTYLPHILLSTVIIGCSVFLLSRERIRHKSDYEKAELFVKLPVAGRWYRYFYTFLVTRELGYFLQSGQQLNQIIEIFRKLDQSSFMNGFILRLEADLKQGRSLAYTIQHTGLFTAGLEALITHAEMTDSLAAQLRIYSRDCYRLLLTDIERKMKFLPPILFAVIGLMILLIYFIMLLPLQSIIKGVM